MDDRRKQLILLIAIFIIGIIFRLLFIYEQPPLGDDVLFVISAENYIERGQTGPSMIHHPNLRNILIYFFTNIFGKGPLGVYGASLFAGVASIILIYIIACELFKNRSVGLISMFFIAIDPLHISFSRQAIQETTTGFFILLGVYLYLLFLKKDSPIFLSLSGIAFGLGTASKWQALFPLVYCLVHLIITKKTNSLKFISFLTILPFTVYLLTFIPWFQRGYDLFEWVNYQKQLYYLNSVHVNPIDEAIKNPTEPLLWFIIPTGHGMFTYSGNTPRVTVAMGNPLVWLLTLISLTFLMLRYKKLYGNAIGLFLISYLPMVFASISRDIYVISAVSITPFAFLLVAGAVNFFREKFKYIFYLYISIVFIISIFMFPLSIGKALDYSYLKPIVETFDPHNH